MSLPDGTTPAASSVAPTGLLPGNGAPSLSAAKSFVAPGKEEKRNFLAVLEALNQQDPSVARAGYAIPLGAGALGEALSLLLTTEYTRGALSGMRVGLRAQGTAGGVTGGGTVNLLKLRPASADGTSPIEPALGFEGNLSIAELNDAVLKSIILTAALEDPSGNPSGEFHLQMQPQDGGIAPIDWPLSTSAGDAAAQGIGALLKLVVLALVALKASLTGADEKVQMTHLLELVGQSGVPLKNVAGTPVPLPPLLGEGLASDPGVALRTWLTACFADDNSAYRLLAALVGLLVGKPSDEVTPSKRGDSDWVAEAALGTSTSPRTLGVSARLVGVGSGRQVVFGVHVTGELKEITSGLSISLPGLTIKKLRADVELRLDGIAIPLGTAGSIPAPDGSLVVKLTNAGDAASKAKLGGIELGLGVQQGKLRPAAALLNLTRNGVTTPRVELDDATAWEEMAVGLVVGSLLTAAGITDISEIGAAAAHISKIFGLTALQSGWPTVDLAKFSERSYPDFLHALSLNATGGAQWLAAVQAALVALGAKPGNLTGTGTASDPSQLPLFPGDWPVSLLWWQSPSRVHLGLGIGAPGVSLASGTGGEATTAVGLRAELLRVGGSTSPATITGVASLGLYARLAAPAATPVGTDLNGVGLHAGALGLHLVWDRLSGPDFAVTAEDVAVVDLQGTTPKDLWRVPLLTTSGLSSAGAAEDAFLDAAALSLQALPLVLDDASRPWASRLIAVNRMAGLWPSTMQPPREATRQLLKNPGLGLLKTWGVALRTVPDPWPLWTLILGKDPYFGATLPALGGKGTEADPWSMPLLEETKHSVSLLTALVDPAANGQATALSLGVRVGTVVSSSLAKLRLTQDLEVLRTSLSSGGTKALARSVFVARLEGPNGYLLGNAGAATRCEALELRLARKGSTFTPTLTLIKGAIAAGDTSVEISEDISSPEHAALIAALMEAGHFAESQPFAAVLGVLGVLGLAALTGDTWALHRDAFEQFLDGESMPALESAPVAMRPMALLFGLLGFADENGSWKRDIAGVGKLGIEAYAGGRVVLTFGGEGEQYDVLLDLNVRNGDASGHVRVQPEVGGSRHALLSAALDGTDLQLRLDSLTEPARFFLGEGGIGFVPPDSDIWERLGLAVLKVGGAYGTLRLVEDVILPALSVKIRSSLEGFGLITGAAGAPRIDAGAGAYFSDPIQALIDHADALNALEFSAFQFYALKDGVVDRIGIRTKAGGLKLHDGSIPKKLVFRFNTPRLGIQRIDGAITPDILSGLFVRVAGKEAGPIFALTDAPALKLWVDDPDDALDLDEATGVGVLPWRGIEGIGEQAVPLVLAAAVNGLATATGTSSTTTTFTKPVGVALQGVLVHLDVAKASGATITIRTDKWKEFIKNPEAPLGKLLEGNADALDAWLGLANALLAPIKTPVVTTKDNKRTSVTITFTNSKDTGFALSLGKTGTSQLGVWLEPKLPMLKATGAVGLEVLSKKLRPAANLHVDFFPAKLRTKLGVGVSGYLLGGDTVEAGLNFWGAGGAEPLFGLALLPDIDLPEAMDLAELGAALVLGLLAASSKKPLTEKWLNNLTLGDLLQGAGLVTATGSGTSRVYVPADFSALDWEQVLFSALATVLEKAVPGGYLYQDGAELGVQLSTFDVTLSEDPELKLTLSPESPFLTDCHARLMILEKSGKTYALAPGLDLRGMTLQLSGPGSLPLVNSRAVVIDSAELAFDLQADLASVDVGAYVSLTNLRFPLTGSGLGALFACSGETPDDAQDWPPLSIGFGYRGGKLLVDLGAEADQPIIWTVIDRRVGPMELSRMGLSLRNDGKRTTHVIAESAAEIGLELHLDCSVDIAGLTVTPWGLTVTVPLQNESKNNKWGVEIDGLGVSYHNDAIDILGAFYHHGTEYLGMARVRCLGFGVDAIGVLDTADPASFFFFGALSLGQPVPLGVILVDTIALGVGINRAFEAPAVTAMKEFALIKQLTGNGQPLSPTNNPFPVQRGSYWAAAGIHGWSLGLIDTSALVYLYFGEFFSAGVLALGILDLPRSSPLVHLEIGAGGALVIGDGDSRLTLRADILSGSYLLSDRCKVFGSAFLGIWFERGDFLLSIGGYASWYVPPSHYPGDLSRLGFDFNISGFHVTGDAFFALTPREIMGGASISADARWGIIHAWLSVGFEVAVGWDPFYYHARFWITIGAEIDLWLFTVGGSVHGEVEIWGPPLCGRARVEICDIDIEVEFGEDSAPPIPPPLSVAQFCERSLKLGTDPLKLERVFRVDVEKGLLPTPSVGDDAAPKPDGSSSAKAVKVAPDTTLRLRSSLPANKVRFAGAWLPFPSDGPHVQESLDLAPCVARDESHASHPYLGSGGPRHLTSRIVVGLTADTVGTADTTDDPVLTPVATPTASQQPKALWWAENPDPNAEVIETVYLADGLTLEFRSRAELRGSGGPEYGKVTLNSQESEKYANPLLAATSTFSAGTWPAETPDWLAEVDAGVPSRRDRGLLGVSLREDSVWTSTRSKKRTAGNTPSNRELDADGGLFGAGGLTLAAGEVRSFRCTQPKGAKLRKTGRLDVQVIEVDRTGNVRAMSDARVSLTLHPATDSVVLSTLLRSSSAPLGAGPGQALVPVVGGRYYANRLLFGLSGVSATSRSVTLSAASAVDLWMPANDMVLVLIVRGGSSTTTATAAVTVTDESGVLQTSDRKVVYGEGRLALLYQVKAGAVSRLRLRPGSNMVLDGAQLVYRHTTTSLATALASPSAWNIVDSRPPASASTATLSLDLP